jgi:D-proline reductase (dithiol) PrdB
LIQRAIESTGVATISISIVRKYTEEIAPPRSIFLRWPFGHPLGEANNIPQQAAVLGKAFEALYQIDEPGVIIDVNWQWRNETYPPVPWLSDPPGC